MRQDTKKSTLIWPVPPKRFLEKDLKNEDEAKQDIVDERMDAIEFAKEFMSDAVHDLAKQFRK